MNSEERSNECEREDCQRIAATASDVYCAITGGLLSYPTYDARTIIAHYEDDVQKTVDEESASLAARLADTQAQLDDLRAESFPKSWAGFRAFLDEVYPDDIFPDDDRDLGPSFVVAARRLAAVERERAELASDYRIDQAAWIETGNAVIARAERAESALGAALARIAAVEALHFTRGRNILGKPVCAECSPLQPMPCPTLRALAASPTPTGPEPAKGERVACPTPCDADCEQPCHEVHDVPRKREHEPAKCAHGPVGWHYAAMPCPGPATPIEPTEETP